MELLFLLLKIILIALLVVLGIIIFLIGAVLFIPIRYEVSGTIGDAWELSIKGKLTYFFSLFKLIFSYQNGQTNIQMYLFGIQKKMKGAELKEEVEKELEDTLEEIDTSEADAEAEVEIRKRNESASEKADDVKTSKVEQTKAAETKQNDRNADKAKSEKKTQKNKKEKTTEKKKLDFNFIKKELTDEHNRSVVKKIWSELGYLLKHFRFRKIQTDLFFGTGDPASTGQVLGILCMIPLLYEYEFKITPDFESEEAYIKGTFLIAGKVRLIHLLRTVLRLVFDKEVRIVVRKVLKYGRK